MVEPILITGCARSGTSMVAGVINLCGAFGGDMSGPNKNNQKGMFENAYVRNSIVKPYYRNIGVDPLGQYPLPDINDLLIPSNWKDTVESVFDSQGLQSNHPWFYKGAKMCQHWPVWDTAFPDAKWVIVRRKTSDIINSCLRTGFMRAFSNRNTQRAVNVSNERDGWLWWVHEHEKRFEEMIAGGLETMQVWPERMVTGDYGQIKEMIEWLGLNWCAADVREFIEPKLYHSRQRKGA